MNTDIIIDMGILAKIAYSDFNGVFIQESLTNNRAISSTEDGNYLLKNPYIVIDYIDDPVTNLQSLLLQKKGTNEYVIAFRGTQEWQDWISNGLTGLLNYNPQVTGGIEFVQDMMATHNIPEANLTLAGHSLGGIITQAIGAELHIQGYAYNPYGANILSSLFPLPLNYYSILGQVLDLFEMGDQNDPWIQENLLTISYQDSGLLNGDILSNLATNFSEFVAGNDHLGGVLPIFGDNAGILDGHSMDTLNAALQHYADILSHFVDTTTLSDLSLVYALNGEDGYTRTESTFSALNITSTADQSLTLNVFATTNTEGDVVSLSPGDIYYLAGTDIAYRYALVSLNPFAITGDDTIYVDFNQNGELDIYNTTTGEGQLSTMYLED